MKFFALIILQFSAIQNQLLTELRNFQNSEGIKAGIVAASIHRTTDNKPMLSFNSDKSVNSASTMKLITTATALSVLGEDFRFITDVGYTGQISNHVLTGDLVILPSGDPSFGSERSLSTYNDLVSSILSTIKVLGIRKIDGNIIIKDPSIYDYDMPDSWIWGDIGNYYGAIPHKLNINENKYTVYFEPGREIGQAAEISSLEPFDREWKIINNVTTGSSSSGDQVYIYASPSSDVILMKGTVPLGKSNFPVKGAIPDPSKLFRNHLIYALRNEGIEITKASQYLLPNEINNEPVDFHLTKRFYSQPLSDLARDCNFFSINLYADAFLHQLGPDGFTDFKGGLTYLKNFWKQKSLTLDGFNPKDGSGLSPSGVITSSNMADILSMMYSSDSFDAFYESIATFGETGSVRYKDRSNKTRGRLKAKSGYIDGTRAYAGYFEDKTGELFSYMICVNRYESDAKDKVRRFLDDFLVKMASR